MYQVCIGSNSVIMKTVDLARWQRTVVEPCVVILFTLLQSSKAISVAAISQLDLSWSNVDIWANCASVPIPK